MAEERVRLTSPDRLLWPQANVTKADLADYYDAVADPLLELLADRPLTIKRHHDGVGRPGFLQKNLPTSAPSWLARHDEPSPSAGRTVSYLLVRTRDDLRWLAQMSAVELHPMTSRVDRPATGHDHRPDRLVIDLDPDADDDHPGASATTAAVAVREVLDEVGLACAPTTTGKRGLHLVAPIERRHTFGEVRGVTLALARAVAARSPDRLTVEMRTADRGGRLLLDWSRSGPAQTLVSPWSPRAVPEATVALPLTWDDVVPGADLPTATVPTAAALLDPSDSGAAARRAWPDLRPQRLERVADALTRRGFPPEDRSPRSRGHGTQPAT